MPAADALLDELRRRSTVSAERYAALRASAFAEPSTDRDISGWAATPEHSDATILAKTGSEWDTWVSLIDAGPGRGAGHAVIAAWLSTDHGVDAWWAQSITVGYERIVGLRLPGQMPDGTFSVSRSKKIATDWSELVRLLDDESSRAVLLGAVDSTRRSRQGVKAPRFSLTDPEAGADLGMVQFRADPARTGCRLVVTHDRLPHARAADLWKEYWASWLQDLSSAESQISDE